MTALTAEIEIGSEVPTALYRCFAKDGALLYVGISGNLTGRMKGHAKHAAWWKRCARRTVTLYATRDDAEVAEAEAILGENPVCNKMGRSLSAAMKHRLTARERRQQREQDEVIRARARAAVESWFPAHLERLAKEAGMPLEEFLATRRAEMAARRLSQGVLSVEAS